MHFLPELAMIVITNVGKCRKSAHNCVSDEIDHMA